MCMYVSCICNINCTTCTMECSLLQSGLYPVALKITLKVDTLSYYGLICYMHLYFVSRCAVLCVVECVLFYMWAHHNNSYQLFCWNGYNKLELEPTWQIEEGVEDIETLCIISLDKLVGVPFTDLWAGKSKKAQKGIKYFIKCLYLWCLLVCRDLCILRGNVENTYPRRKLNPWTQTRILP